jgi:Zn-dependent oligopeptidase
MQTLTAITILDFLEVPSMMLENWIYEAAVLNRISGHYQSGAPLPSELIQNLVKTKTANAAYGHRRKSPHLARA